MTDRPILMSAAMVRALLDGRKVQTRRLARRIKALPVYGVPPAQAIVPTIWQSVEPGDRLWVRETWAKTTNVNGEDDWPGRPCIVTDEEDERTYEAVIYQSDGSWDWVDDSGFLTEKSYWKSSIHMPREFSRLTLIITATKMERVQEISAEDAQREGAMMSCAGIYGASRKYLTGFWETWQSLHTKPGARWEDNPEVVALTFEVHQRNIDQMERAAL